MLYTRRNQMDAKLKSALGMGLLAIVAAGCVGGETPNSEESTKKGGFK